MYMFMTKVSENNLCKNLGDKEGGGCLLEGEVLSCAYGTWLQNGLKSYHEVKVVTFSL